MTAPRPTFSATSGHVCVGVVTGARGLQGEVRIKSYTADPADIAAYGPLFDESGRRSFRLRVTGRAKGQVVAGIAGVDDRDAAEALKGLDLYIPRQALPEIEEDEYYNTDLIGMRAELVAGAEAPEGCPEDRVLGSVKAVHDFGGGPILEIERLPVGRRGGDAVMVPFTAACVPEVDLAGARLTIDPPPGLLDPAPPPATDGEDKEGT